MPSLALQRWRTDRATTLDEIESVHRSVGGAGHKKRSATQQLNQAYALLLSSQFQGFCRDLHTECADAVTDVLPSPDLKSLMSDGLLLVRKLDTRNRTPETLAPTSIALGCYSGRWLMPPTRATHGARRCWNN